MKNLSPIIRNDDLVNKKYVDDKVPKTLSQLTGDSTHRLVSDTEKSTWNEKEDSSNKTNSISSSSTNTQYPSAKAVYDLFTSITNGDNVSY